jgi:hypothetical protein
VLLLKNGIFIWWANGSADFTAIAVSGQARACNAIRENLG